MEALQRIKKEIQPNDISELLTGHYSSLMSAFYETQNEFLTGVYKRYGSIETANIIIYFARNTHLQIIRQREKDLNFDISLNNFWDNFQNTTIQSEKVSSVVVFTGIPKETVRRKVKKLLKLGYLLNDKNTKGYIWTLSSKYKNLYQKAVDDEIRIFSNFIFKIAKCLGLQMNIELVEKKIKSQFSFYWYHFLSCQLQFLKMWQLKLKDNDLLLIVLQAVIPTLQYAEKIKKDTRIDNIFKIIGKIDSQYNFSKTSVSASAVSEITGIPRATCIRKLDKLRHLGFLTREQNTKRYLINQNMTERTKNILTKENVSSTVDCFSGYLAIILNSLLSPKG